MRSRSPLRKRSLSPYSRDPQEDFNRGGLTPIRDEQSSQQSAERIQYDRDGNPNPELGHVPLRVQQSPYNHADGMDVDHDDRGPIRFHIRSQAPAPAATRPGRLFGFDENVNQERANMIAAAMSTPKPAQANRQPLANAQSSNIQGSNAQNILQVNTNMNGNKVPEKGDTGLVVEDPYFVLGISEFSTEDE